MNLIEEKVEAVKQMIDADAEKEIKALERMKYRLSDAIREGSKVSDQAYNWSEPNGNMCAMSAAVVAAKARGYM